MPFNIDEFRAFANKYSFLRSNRFEIRFIFPPGMNDSRPNVQTMKEIYNQIKFTSDAINVPATSLHTHQVRRYGYGALDTQPVFPIFNQIQAMFLVDDQALVHKFFSEWLKIIVNYDHSQPIGSNSKTTTVSGNPMGVYEISYRHEYVVNMEILQYDMVGANNKPVRHTVYRNCFPVSMGDLNLNWQVNNEVVRLPIMFSFVDWYDKQLSGE